MFYQNKKNVQIPEDHQGPAESGEKKREREREREKQSRGGRRPGRPDHAGDRASRSGDRDRRPAARQRHDHHRAADQGNHQRAQQDFFGVSWAKPKVNAATAKTEIIFFISFWFLVKYYSSNIKIFLSLTSELFQS